MTGGGIMIRLLWAIGCRGALVLAGSILALSAVMLGLAYPAAGWLVLIVAAWQRCRRGWQVTGNYGTARIADWRDLARGKLMCRRGLILGRLGFVPPPSRGEALRALCNPLVGSERACQMVYSAFLDRWWKNDGFIRINDFTHLGTFAPAGGGKTVSTLAPNLLAYNGNCVVIDKGGELYQLTHKHRQAKFGHTVVRLDPGQLFGPGGDCFNVFTAIDPHALDCIGRCRDLANMIVVRTGLEHDPHFPDSAENMIAAFSAYVRICEGDPAAINLKGMRAQIVSKVNYTAALERMREIEEFHGILQELGHSLTWHVDRELGSVMSTTQRYTHIFGDPMVDAATWRTSFKPEELRSGRMTVYIIVPPDRMTVWAPLWRVWLGTLLRIVTRGVPGETNPVLFMCDETAHIGRMQVLEDAITLLRGSGARIWLFFQSLNQLNKCFGEGASTVLDNLKTQQYYAINSYETAEANAKRIGTGSVMVRTGGRNSGYSRSTGVKSDGGSANTGTTENWSETGRQLFMPEEILTLDESVGMVFHKNNPVILVELIKYYSDKAFRHRPWRGYGTGRSRGLGLAGMMLAVAALALSGAVAGFVASLPVRVSQPRRAVAPGGHYGFGGSGGYGPPYSGSTDWLDQSSPHEPGQPGWRPVPYRRPRRPYSY